MLQLTLRSEVKKLDKLSNQVDFINNLVYNLNYLVGVVDRLDAIRFKRMVFRASKGNAWIVMSDIEYSRLDSTLEAHDSNLAAENDKSAAKNI